MSFLARAVILLTLSIITLSSCAKKEPPMLATDQSLNDLAKQIAKDNSIKPNNEIPEEFKGHSDSDPAVVLNNKPSLEQKLIEKRLLKSMVSENTRILSVASTVEGHTNLYNFVGKYRVMVIPVQFNDFKFADQKFLENKAQNYLFGKDKTSMAQYYAHASYGQLKIEGEVTPIITLDGNLSEYGEAMGGGTSDKNPKGLVMQALLKLKEQKQDQDWWSSFDNWDLSDYDNDKHFHEQDGFIDAVIIIYAGKSQASCQRSFDPEGTRPATSEVPAGPRQQAAIECFNRIWPHRWALSLAENDPNYSSKGPIVEGTQRPSLNGLKIHDSLFALDYNMQSEYSDISTFIHEFGHSLTLPDVYSQGKSNSTGGWEIMSQNAELHPQEFSTYSRLSLGWLAPKIVRQGEKTSAYLGHTNFVTHEQRENFANFLGPVTNTNNESIISSVPGFGENVYRSLVVLTQPTAEKIYPTDSPIPTEMGIVQAYSGKTDGAEKKITIKLTVPNTGDQTLSFDTIYAIETETNFHSKDEEIKVITDYDIGVVAVNGNELERLRLISGDKNYDSLAEDSSVCEANRVLELRLKKIISSLSEDETKEFTEKTALCQKAIWVTKKYDLAAYAGQEIEFTIAYITDPGYTEFGIIVDNIKLSDRVVDFEFESPNELGSFVALQDGHYNVFHGQFYLMEYRNPGETYLQKNKEVSYNMDNNIREGSQSYFVAGNGELRERFRMVEFNYQPGVLVWYFNSKFDRRSNDATAQAGKGYLLVLNSKVQELPLPGVLGAPELFDENGNYDENLESFKETIIPMRKDFTCFAYTKYATYLDGVAPECSHLAEQEIDDIFNLKFNNKKLMYRRERFNDILPQLQDKFYGSDQPHRTGAGVRTGLSTFRPSDAAPFKPFKVFKVENSKLVIDQNETESSYAATPVDSFDDSLNELSAYSQFHGDSVVVEKKGFKFKLANPAKRVLEQYSINADPNNNDHYLRRPLVKVLVDWE